MKAGFPRDDIRQDQPIEPQHGERSVDDAPRPLQVGETLPAVCTIHHVAQVLGKSVARVYQLQKAGFLRAFELEPIGDKRIRYNGRLLQQWVDGTLDRSFINGNLRRPRTFGRKAS